MDRLSQAISAYQKAILDLDIQFAYEWLIKYMMALKACASKHYENSYSFGAVSPGYMDFTYFSFSNQFLRDRKLRFGIVLNHKEMQLELWLLGQNVKVQTEYWELLKSSKWNEGKSAMPKYSVAEVVLKNRINFEDASGLSTGVVTRTVSLDEEPMLEVLTEAFKYSQEICAYLETP